MALNYCSDRYRNFRLPDRINKIVINSQGYIYGEHRFALEQQDVLNLVMGESLYKDPYVYVRELLQNAIDTSRHRRFYENAQGISRSPEQELVIEVTHWTDNDGYKWGRVDDYGMGMDRNIIENYMIKIGKSYYNSPDFKADIFEYKQRTGKDFTPISRFGIGILSCFIVGDRVEISTKKENGEPVMDGSNFDLFPPLFFVPYVDSNKLRKGKYPLNLKHNFSKWLVENSIPMSKKYPGIFYSFREHNARGSLMESIEDIVKNVNILIDRLLELDESFDNKQDIRLKVEDFDYY